MFRHEALLYSGADELVAQLLPFVRDGLDARDDVMVALEASKLDRLRTALGEDAARVRFADMHALGANPARILPAWQDFVDAGARGGRRMRGVGEPVWPGRTAVELQECHCHESLLNVAFEEREDFWLVCPYDTAALAPGALATAAATHPFMVEHGALRSSATFTLEDTLAAPLDDAPPEGAVLEFDRADLAAVRAFAHDQAVTAGLSLDRVDGLLLAVNEVATNAVLHGDGCGELRIWRDGDALVCECRDSGRIEDPLVGRRRPVGAQVGGFGLWIVNQLCELVQVRSTPAGSVVRMFVRR